MKKVFACIIIGTIVCTPISAQEKNDTINKMVNSTIEMFYNNIIPMLDKVEITGSGELSNELRTRWHNMVNHIKNNKSNIVDEAMDLLINPTGITTDFESIKKFIQWDNTDSVGKIKINPDILLLELMKAKEKVVDAAVELSTSK